MESYKLVQITTIFIFLFVLANNLVVAIEPTYIFKQGDEANLKFSCVESNGFLCGSDYLCNITIQYPNSTLMIDNLQSTRNPSYYNITIPDTSALGFHQYQAYCNNVTDAGVSQEQYFLINLTGEDLNISTALIYLVMLLVSIIFFALSLYGSVIIKWKNESDFNGNIISINDLKYIKLFLWFVCYIFLIFITYILTNLSGFLALRLLFVFFEWINLFLLVFVLPIFIITFLVGFIKFFNDKKLFNLLQRGAKVKNRRGR